MKNLILLLVLISVAIPVTGQTRRAAVTKRPASASVYSTSSGTD